MPKPVIERESDRERLREPLDGTMEREEKGSSTSPTATVTNAFLPLTSTLCVDFDSVFSAHTCITPHEKMCRQRESEVPKKVVMAVRRVVLEQRSPV